MLGKFGDSAIDGFSVPRRIKAFDDAVPMIVETKIRGERIFEKKTLTPDALETLGMQLALFTLGFDELMVSRSRWSELLRAQGFEIIKSGLTTPAIGYGYIIAQQQ